MKALSLCTSAEEKVAPVADQRHVLKERLQPCRVSAIKDIRDAEPLHEFLVDGESPVTVCKR
jgi:hypothetical protein